MKRLFILAHLLLLSLLLLTMAWPRFKANLAFFPVQKALSSSHYKTMNNLQLAALIVINQQVIVLHDEVTYWESLVLLYYFQAKLLKTDPLGKIKTLKLALNAVQIVLSRKPINAVLWYRLASIYHLLDDEPKKIIEALEFSILTGRSNRGLQFARISLALSYWSDIPSDSLAIFREQINRLSLHHHRDYLKLGKKFPDFFSHYEI